MLMIAGGVSLILFAVRFLRKGFDRMLGYRLHAWIERLCRQSRLGTVAAGVTFGTVAPSSTAQTLFTLQLLNEGRLRADRLLVFLLGANVGITVTVQVLSLRLSEWHPLLLTVGVAGFLWFRSEVLRGLGQVVLALGFLLLGMSMIGAAAHALSASDDIQIVATVLQRREGLLLLFAALLTVITQSSTATIGLAIGFALSGTGTATTTLSVVLGANLGLSLITAIAGWKTAAGRQLAAANFLLKGTAIAAAFLWLRPAAGWLAEIFDEARLAANVHTGFNVFVALIGTAVAKQLGRLTCITNPSGIARPGPRTTQLDPMALANPVLALASAAREVLLLADGVKIMLTIAWRACREGNRELARQIRQDDDRVDEQQAVIKHYLGRIPVGAMTGRDRELHFGLLHFSSQLEAIADIAEKSLAREADRRGGQPLALPADDLAALVELQQRVLRRFDLAMAVLTNRDTVLARRLQQDGDDLKDWCMQAQRAHYLRLGGGDLAAQEASARFLELFHALRRISGLLNAIGHTVLVTD